MITNTESAFDNLYRLGLVNNTEIGSLTNKDLYKPLKEHKFLDEYKKFKELIDEGFEMIYLERVVNLTAFGQIFCHVCIENPVE